MEFVSNENGWSKIKYNNSIGYIYSNLVYSTSQLGPAYNPKSLKLIRGASHSGFKYTLYRVNYKEFLPIYVSVYPGELPRDDEIIMGQMLHQITRIWGESGFRTSQAQLNKRAGVNLIIFKNDYVTFNFLLIKNYLNGRTNAIVFWGENLTQDLLYPIKSKQRNAIPKEKVIQNQDLPSNAESIRLKADETELSQTNSKALKKISSSNIDLSIIENLYGVTDVKLKRNEIYISVDKNIFLNLLEEEDFKFTILSSHIQVIKNIEELKLLKTHFYHEKELLLSSKTDALQLNNSLIFQSRDVERVRFPSSSMVLLGLSVNSSKTDSWIFDLTYSKSVTSKITMSASFRLLGGPPGFLLDEPSTAFLDNRNDQIITQTDSIIVFDDVSPADTSEFGKNYNHSLTFDVWSPAIELFMLRENELYSNADDRLNLLYGLGIGGIIFRPKYDVITQRLYFFRKEQWERRGVFDKSEGWYQLSETYTRDRTTYFVPFVSAAIGVRAIGSEKDFGFKYVVEMILGYQISGSVTRNTQVVDILEDIHANFSGVYFSTRFGIPFN